ncbi:inhibitor of growth protein 5-like protein [Phascolomyces articulosus]|uniref:Chromatin modification-related protein n=1 Tax=Phascolomyces articulosus TaxID=60185 RepID=A0AAD5K724_9FUNG|nr:inhibitor of growth protein 5-like protein [Phascolomyces articulosus]
MSTRTTNTATDDDLDRISYLGGYSDTVEALPLELHRNFTLIRQLDESAQELMNNVSKDAQSIMAETTVLSPKERQERLSKIGSLLNEALKRGEEKFALAKSTYDTVDRHCTKLDTDLQKYEDEQLIGPTRKMGIATVTSTGAGTSVASVERTEKSDQVGPKKRKGNQKGTTGRGRKKVARAEEESQQGEYLSTEDSRQHAQAAISLSNLPIDPNEPLYCYCQQVSFGEMVACDNDECEIEWFHLECVGLRTPPKGKWYCKNCAEQLKIKQKK